MNKIKPFHVDGALYFGVAFFGVLSVALGSNEAFDLFSPKFTFWAKNVVNSLGAGCLALKTFRSTAYADHKEEAAVAAGADPIRPLTTPVVLKQPDQPTP